MVGGGVGGGGGIEGDRTTRGRSSGLASEQTQNGRLHLLALTAGKFFLF